VKYAIDTSILVDHLRNYGPAVALLDRLLTEDAQLVSSHIIRTEVLAGMLRGEENRTLKLLGLIEWDLVGERESDAAGALGRRHLPANTGIDTPDLLLGEVAQRQGAELLTLNVKHFKAMFPGLDAPYSY
jgi:predicted nucleic acid-binding protein